MKVFSGYSIGASRLNLRLFPEFLDKNFVISGFNKTFRVIDVVTPERLDIQIIIAQEVIHIDYDILFGYSSNDRNDCILLNIRDDNHE